METLFPSRAEERLEREGCAVCRGMARLCKLATYPYYRELLGRAYLQRLSTSSSIHGPSPPSLLVGEQGYPRISTGPTVTVAEGVDAWVLESPRDWLSRPLEELLALRLSLLYGRRRLRVEDARRRERILGIIQESAASTRPVDMEMRISGGLRIRPGFGVRSAPHGPSARLEDLRLVENASIPRRMDEVMEEKTLPAREAIVLLSKAGLDEYYLARVFSAGLVGRLAERRLVPTEWSITAIDDMLARDILREVRRMPVIPKFRVHTYSAHHNSAWVVLTPTPWMYELLEGWAGYPGGSLYSDHEYLGPRRSYAENTGGAYYAVRLPILRHLSSQLRQAGAIVFFEVRPGWIPLGVWRFREIVRAALERPPLSAETLNEALSLVEPHLMIPITRYIERSALIRILRLQTKLGVEG